MCIRDRIRNDPANVRVLAQGDTDLSAANLDQAIDGMANDALVILHKGKVVHESYRNGMTRHDPHILMSVSKSMLGLVMGTLVERGEVAVDDLLTKYLPELSGTLHMQGPPSGTRWTCRWGWSSKRIIPPLQA